MTNAQIAGRVAGIAYVHTRRTVALIDWAEVAAIVLHGLQVLIALTVLAGQMTRRAWDALTDGCTGLRMVYNSLTGAPVTPTHPEPRTMAIPALTAAEADAALKPFGIRVTPWGKSKTKFCVFQGDHGSQTMLKTQVVELIELRQQYG